MTQRFSDVGDVVVNSHRASQCLQCSSLWLESVAGGHFIEHTKKNKMLYIWISVKEVYYYTYCECH